MKRLKLFAALNVARRQLKEAGLESESRFLTREAMRHECTTDALTFIEAFLDMVLVPLPTAPTKTEG